MEAPSFSYFGPYAVLVLHVKIFVPSGLSQQTEKGATISEAASHRGSLVCTKSIVMSAMCPTS